MNLLRLLAIIFFIWLVGSLVRNYLNRRTSSLTQKARTGTMVRCIECGLHIPETEAVKRGDNYYCCPQHRDGV